MGILPMRNPATHGQDAHATPNGLGAAFALMVFDPHRSIKFTVENSHMLAAQALSPCRDQ